jgi:nucleoside phosphorylase
LFTRRLAQVCHDHGVPFLAVKDISNNELHRFSATSGAGGSAPEAQEGLDMAAIGRQAAAVAMATVSVWCAARRDSPEE